jgi:hypothetical protein
MKVFQMALIPFALAATARAAAEVRAEDYLRPQVVVGDRLDSIFSKTVAITGDGFSPIVKRISGSASDHIAAVSSDEIIEHESYLYDGRPAGEDEVRVRDHGRTNCVDGKCATNDQTSAPLFNPLLWGDVPGQLNVGTSWAVTIDKPWEIGPAGEERIKVTRIDRATGLVALIREGEGTGPSSDDARTSALPVMVGGKTLMCRIVPGKSHWLGMATVIRGVTWADEIVLDRPVELIAESGEHLQGSERIYTLFQRAPTMLDDLTRPRA